MVLKTKKNPKYFSLFLSFWQYKLLSKTTFPFETVSRQLLKWSEATMEASLCLAAVLMDYPLRKKSTKWNFRWCDHRKNQPGRNFHFYKTFFVLLLIFGFEIVNGHFMYFSHVEFIWAKKLNNIIFKHICHIQYKGVGNRSMNYLFCFEDKEISVD